MLAKQYLSRMSRKLTRSFASWIIFTCISPLAITQSYETPDEPTQIFLKLNNFYVLYMTPAPPFLTPEGDVFVPLKSFATLIGGSISFFGNPPSAASITRANTRVTVTKTNKVIVTDLKTNQQNVLDYSTIKAIWRQEKGEVFVATDFFRVGFFISDNFDPWLNIMTMLDTESIENQDVFNLFEMLPTILNPGIYTPIIQPVSFKLESGKVKLDLKLWESFDLPVEDILVTFIFTNEDGSSAFVGPIIAPEPTYSPCKRDGNLFTCETFLKENYHYIFAHISVVNSIKR